MDSSSSASDLCKAINADSEGPKVGEMLRDSERRYLERRNHSSGTQNLKCRLEVDLKGFAEKGNSTKAEICEVGGSRETSKTELKQ